MDTSTTSLDGGPRKVALEDMTKEELVKKCRNLLTIAQKAKQARDALVEENNKLKFEGDNASQELIFSLTQQKLELVTTVDTLKRENKTAQEQLIQLSDELAVGESKTISLDTENQSFKIQVARLTEENEQLLTHLDGLEAQIDELKRIGLEQQEQLLTLEQSNENVGDGKQVIELQSMLAVSLDEVQKLQTALNEKEATFNDSIMNYDLTISEMEVLREKVKQQDDEITKQISLTDDLNTELHRNRALAEKLKLDLNNKSKKLNANQIESSGINAELQNTNEKLREKLKNYHGKIIKLAGDVRKVKESKEYILDTFKLYNGQVNNWKEQLTIVSLKLHDELQCNADEKQQLTVKLQQFQATRKQDGDELKQLRDQHEVDAQNIQKLEELLNEMENVKSENVNLHDTVDVMRAQIANLEASNNHSNTQETVALVAEHKIALDAQNAELDELRREISQEKLKCENLTDLLENERAKDNSRLIGELKKAIEKLEADVENSHLTESKISEQNNQTILILSQENKSYLENVDMLQRKVALLEAEHEAALEVPTLKRENGELLAEMNIMNQALKERGETISQQQAHCDEILKKLQIYEGQLAKSQEHNQHLQDEIAVLRSQSAQEDDAMSTISSNISRCDELNRMKDLEGSWEERYGKLRSYALKLKAKAKELQEELGKTDAEKVELQGRAASHIKTVHSMQNQLDALQDKVDATKGKDNRLEQLTKDNQKLLMQSATFEEEIYSLKTHIEGLTQEKTNLDQWKKQVGTKVAALKKELEANTLMRKDFESRIAKLQHDLESKTKELAAEHEKHQTTRSQLHESNNACKKQSVLTLEMQDYERSIKDLSTKLEKKQEQVTKLKNQIDAQKSSVNATKEQNRLANEKCRELELELDASRIEIKTFRKQIADLEITIGDKENKMEEITKMMEATRGENEDLSTQLSKIIAEHQKANNMLREEKDHFRNENVELEQRMRKLDDQLRLQHDELSNVSSEYQSYKVRAQSVLRQNQNRDVGVEEKLSEEADSLRAQIQISRVEIQELKGKLTELEAAHEKLLQEKTLLESSLKDIQGDYELSKQEIEKLNAKYQQTTFEHNETVRSLKLHTETLSQCYRQQLSEQEVRHNREIIELQSKADKSSLPQDIPSLLIPTTIREEGEGSESVDSNNGNLVHPLEKLLGADQEQELASVRKQLSENEMRVVHLTALLADTEQDLAKHVQMNKLLKEEIRRQQRSVERERHAENLEYMKNVVFKFITLTSGDERLRLVPVLNTILKLSPEETSKLNAVAKSDKSWSTYLPSWSGAGHS